jgi:hypothetical protein
MAKKFPGWQDVGSFIRHVQFVKSHHQQIQRVALAVNGMIPRIMESVASRIVDAEIKHFPLEKQDEAKKWVKAA